GNFSAASLKKSRLGGADLVGPREVRGEGIGSEQASEFQPESKFFFLFTAGLNGLLRLQIKPLYAHVRVRFFERGQKCSEVVIIALASECERGGAKRHARVNRQVADQWRLERGDFDASRPGSVQHGFHYPTVRIAVGHQSFVLADLFGDNAQFLLKFSG